MGWLRKGPGSQNHLSSLLALVSLRCGPGQLVRGVMAALGQVKQLVCPAGVDQPGGKSSAEANLKWGTGRLW
jgi:hypothetical protein